MVNRTFFGVIALLLATIAIPGQGSLAQVATPLPPQCVAPAPVQFVAPSNLPTPVPTATAISVQPTIAQAGASPAASAEGTASPVAIDYPPADAATVAAITDLSQAVADCLSTGATTGIELLVTERYLGMEFGGSDTLSVPDFAELYPLLPPMTYRIQSVENVFITGPKSAIADVTFIAGNQVRAEEQAFVFVPVANGSSTGNWLVDGAISLPIAPDPAAENVAVSFREYAVTVSPSSVQGPNLTVNARNSGEEWHEVLVLKFDPTVSPEALLTSPDGAFPEGVLVAGQMTLAPGTSGVMSLSGLVSGTYTVVCLLPNSEGVPHLSLGEITTFTLNQ